MINPVRFKVLLGIALVLLVLVVWHWISGWGLVTVHADAQPLAKIIRSIERQGGIKIVTNADLSTPVTMDVDRVPPVEAMDTVSAWLDGNWTISYAAGATKAEVAAAIAALEDGDRRNEDFARFGGGFSGGFEAGDGPVDARRISWTVSPSESPLVQAYIDQLAQKTGLTAITPRGWNPAVAAPPKGGPAGPAMRELVNAAKGEVREVFVIRVRNDELVADAGGREEGASRADRASRTDGGFGGASGGAASRPRSNPEWMAEREQARIAQLPAGEREQAKKDASFMREAWQNIRSLPEAERRVAMDKLMNDPAVQERMTERMMSREAKRSPERRAQRFRQYIERKQQMKASS